MKLNILIAFILLFGCFSLSAQVGINTTTPDPSAMLEIASDDKGILIPRLTTVNRMAMANVQGMLVYDQDFNQFFYNDGVQWLTFGAATTTRQAGTLNVGTTSAGWQYFNVTFPSPFTLAPIINITLREGIGIDNAGSNTIDQIKVANATTTGFTIGIQDDGGTNDVFIDWIAVPQS